jgi:NitT/TauT family transport system ATP-binding protein
VLAGLHPFDSGEVTIGTKAQPFDPSRDIGMVFQQPLLLKWRRIIDNVLLPAEILGLPMTASRSRARDLLALVGLKGNEDKYPTSSPAACSNARRSRARSSMIPS